VSLQLEFCLLTDPRYQKIRDAHYVENNGVHGQQVHFLVHYRGEIVGIISGGSAAYATAPRDKFFGITKENRQAVLSGVINNIVFRLEKREHGLASRCVKLWRDVVTPIWEDLYGAKVFGYETFIVQDRTKIAKGGSGETDRPVYKKTTGCGLYGFDGWASAGITEGNTKTHSKGLTVEFKRVEVSKKLVVCRWRDGFSVPVEGKGTSSWMAGKTWEQLSEGSRKGTTKEKWDKQREVFKEIAKQLSVKRKNYLGKFFEETIMDRNRNAEVEKTCEKCQTSYKRDKGYKHRDGLCVGQVSPTAVAYDNDVQLPTPAETSRVQPPTSIETAPFTVLDWQRQLVEKEVNSRLELLRAKIEAEVIAELKIGLEELERPSF